MKNNIKKYLFKPISWVIDRWFYDELTSWLADEGEREIKRLAKEEGYGDDLSAWHHDKQKETERPIYEAGFDAGYEKAITSPK